MEPSSAEDGNRAAGGDGLHADDASMEPSSAEDGNAVCDSCSSRERQRFNGAVLS